MRNFRYKGITIYESEPTKDGRKYFFKKYKNGKHYSSEKYKTTDEVVNAYSRFVLKNNDPINKRFDLVADDYFDNLKKIRKESTVYTYIKDYNKHIYPYFKHSYINCINVSDIRKWAEMLEKIGYKIEYLNKLYNILKNIFDFGMKNYNLEINPVSVYGRFQEKNDKITTDEDKLRYITLDQFNQFISVVDNIMWKTLFSTLFYTGCRKGELLALTWNDINFNLNEITINKTLYDNIKGKTTITSTKNNLNRKIIINKTLKNILINYKNEVMKFTDYSDSWFVFGNTTNLASTTINRYKHKYFELSGIKEITIHEFRHSHVSLLINEYIKVSKEKNMKVDTTKFFLMMSNRMGHTIEVMQRTYMHLFPTIQDEIVDLLDNL